MLEVGRVWNVWPVEEMVDCSNVDGIMKLCPYRNPDVFVIDIDGIDFHVLQSVLEPPGTVRKSSSWNTTAHLALSKRSRFHTNHVSKGFKLILRDCITVHPLPRGAR